MLARSPWTLARHADGSRRALLLFVVAALLFGFGMHAARACIPVAPAAAQAHAVQPAQPCHGEVDLAQAACETHCNSDAQSGRASLNFDLSAAAPTDLAVVLAPPVPVGPLALDTAPPRRDTGPPLHILLHRLLR